ncbi:MAG TPA: hypothetical protein PK907_01625 [Candidatus Sabulitectum sp.]|nr:hypothetical protein [Candidatus Sabulitectum sp.]
MSEPGKGIVILIGLSLFVLLCSVSLHMLHWRASNEPGAGDFPGLLTAAWSAFLVGLTGFAWSAAVFVRKGHGRLLHAAAACAAAILLYLPLLVLTLLMMA